MFPNCEDGAFSFVRPPTWTESGRAPACLLWAVLPKSSELAACDLGGPVLSPQCAVCSLGTAPRGLGGAAPWSPNTAPRLTGEFSELLSWFFISVRLSPLPPLSLWAKRASGYPAVPRTWLALGRLGRAQADAGDSGEDAPRVGPTLFVSQLLRAEDVFLPENIAPVPPPAPDPLPPVLLQKCRPETMSQRRERESGEHRGLPFPS